MNHGTTYFDQARGANFHVNDVLPRNIAHRPVTCVRPLTIGAPLTDEFNCLAPADWNAKRVLGNLFELYEFMACGWTIYAKLENLGGDLDYCRWRVAK